MKPRRIFSALLLSLGLILLTFAATCRLVMTNIQCSTMREAKADRKAYIENEHICPMIRKRRYPIHNNTVC